MPSSTEPSTPEPTGWWAVRALRPDGSVAWVGAVHSREHEDDVRLELPEAEAREVIGEDAFYYAMLDADGAVNALLPTRLAAPKAPPLWFADLPEPTSPPPSQNLVAFTGHGVETGRLVSRSDLRDVPVTSEDQVGAARWYPATGEVDQIYVAPQWRRRSIGGALAAACGMLSVARGWPRLWGDGQRTAMGERWRNASPWAHRTADLTHLSPPMTPYDER